MTSVAALLAAGAGSRFAGTQHKLLSPFRGRPLWTWALQRAVDAGFDHVVVVTGAVDLSLPPDLVTPPRTRIAFVGNADWASGQASSLRMAVDAAHDAGAAAVTVGLADQPFVTASAWSAVRDADTACRIVVATYDGRSGPHPVRLGADVWPLLPAAGDAGAREVLDLHPEWVCRVPCLGSVDDIDTVEDLDRWKSC